MGHGLAFESGIGGDGLAKVDGDVGRESVEDGRPEVVDGVGGHGQDAPALQEVSVKGVVEKR